MGWGEGGKPLSDSHNIHWPKYLKGQMIFSHRQYYYICPFQRPINLIASDQDCSILLQHFEEASKFEIRRISIHLMPCSLKWIKFCNEFSEIEAFFWQYINQHKRDF